MTQWLLGFLAGVVIAAVTTPVGVSGAVFLLPFQLSVLQVPSPAVTPTNLLYNVISVPGSIYRYSRNGSLRSPLTAQILLGTLPGVVLGALLRIFVLPGGIVFRVLVAVLLLPLGIWLLARRETAPRARLPRPALVVALGFAAGLVGGVYGIGGGALLAPVLVGLGCGAVLVAPATLVATFVTSLAGVAVYASLALAGHPQAAPDWNIALACGLGGLVGGYVGAALQPRLSADLLRRGLGLVSIGLALSYLLAVL